MKVLLLAVLLGIAAARSIQDSKHAVYEAVVATRKGMDDAGRLWQAVGLPECASELNAVEKDMKTWLGKTLKEALDKIVNGFKEKVDDVKDIVANVKNKLADLKERLQELAEKGKEKSQEAIDLVKKKVHDIVDSILDNIRKKKDNFDEQMDEASKLKIKDLIHEIQGKISEKVHNIREYIKDIAVDNEVVRELKALLDKIKDNELAHILNSVLTLSDHEFRHLKDLFEKLKEIGAKSKGVLKDKISDLTDWVRNTWQDGLEEMREKFHNVKSSLLEFISNAKDFSVEAIREALKHLESYKDHFGDLYEKLVDSLKKAIGKF